jgi:hypothetical protein
MTSTTLGGRTEWERRQYERDHGQRAAVALAYRLIADFISTDEDGPVPPPTTVYVPVSKGTQDERAAAVQAWAAAHNVTAGWDEERHHYFAKLPFGPLSLMVYMLPDTLPAPAAREGAPVLEAVAG